MNSIVIVNQEEISASFSGSSLFVNGVHIADKDENNELPLLDITEALSKALSMPILVVKISEKQLAEAVAELRGDLDVLKQDIADDVVDFEDWNQGYTNNDVLFALKKLQG